MKIYTYMLILLGSLLLACSPAMPPSPAPADASSLYSAASAKHYQLARGEIPSTEAEWVSLIEEFQRAIDAEAEGEWADDAQYAIASCWLWLGQSNEQPAVDNAIDALNKLHQDYPDSPHAADAHYWLGDCYNRLGDHSKAVAHYQTVISRYPNDSAADKAQLRLGRAYEAQGYFTLARITYEALSRRSQNSQIIAQAERRASRLDTEQTEDDAPVDSPPVIVESPQVVQLSPPETLTEENEPPPKSPKAPQLSSNVSLPPKADVKPKTVVPPSEARPPAQKPHAKDKTVTSSHTPGPPVADPSLAQQLGLSVKTIVIDPGHGGKDPGAVSQTRQEKQIVLSLSKTLSGILVKKGYNVQLTRATDVFIPLRKRTQFATDQKADLFISIHTNASTARQAAGIETYYLALASDESARITAMRENAGAEYNMKELDALVGRILKESKSTESRRLAELIQAQLTSEKQVKNRGVKHAPFVVLIGTKVPAVLVEVGFISNPREGKKLTTKAYQRQLATAIAKGIEQYIKNLPPAAANQS
jgi:N-acetylmuramoyl-L-alanine amidase